MFDWKEFDFKNHWLRNGIIGIAITTLFYFASWGGDIGFASYILMPAAIVFELGVDCMMSLGLLGEHDFLKFLALSIIWLLVFGFVCGVIIAGLVRGICGCVLASFPVRKAEEFEDEQISMPRISKLSATSMVVAIISLLYGVYGLDKRANSYDVLIQGVKEFNIGSVAGGYLMAATAIVLSSLSLSVIKKKKIVLFGKTLAIGAIALALAAIVILSIVLYPLMDKTGLCGKHLQLLTGSIELYSTVDFNWEDKSFPPIGRRIRDEEIYPDPDKWCDQLVERTINMKLFTCPSVKQGRCHYAMNPYAKPDSPGDVVLLFETKAGWNQFGGPELLNPQNHNGRGCNIVFNDMHVEFVKTEDFDKLRWEP